MSQAPNAGRGAQGATPLRPVERSPEEPGENRDAGADPAADLAEAAARAQRRARRNLALLQPDPAEAPAAAPGDTEAQSGAADATPETPPARSPRQRALAMLAEEAEARPEAEVRPEAAVEPEAQVAPATMRTRHWGLLASFVLLVLAPLVAASYYLFARAADQYHSELAFSIRSEEMSSAAAGLLGALTQINSGASDADILYEYIRSQEIVAAIDRKLDLRAIWNRPESDPWFTLGDDPTIEALHAQWTRMVSVTFDNGAGIIHVLVRAFRPEDATAVAAEILAESDALVNALSEQAREDAVGFARDELAEAEGHLRDVRQRVADFRREYKIVDPEADVAGQMGLLNALQAELAQALVDRDVLTSYAAEGDQRVQQADRRISAITGRLEEERSSLAVSGVGASLPEVVGRYEELLVDLEFANTAYTQSLAAVAAARAEARRQSRYLAPHIRPTAAESALYPRRLLLAGLIGLFLTLGWGILGVVYYNVRDNR